MNTPCEDCNGTGCDAGGLGWHNDACPACHGSGTEPAIELTEPAYITLAYELDAAPVRKPAASVHPMFAEILGGFRRIR